MRAVKARFDGRKIILPEDAAGHPPGEVIVVFQDAETDEAEKTLWLAAAEQSFAKVWDNEDDAVYDDV